jgi:dTDP-4-amino-4,6-dideoxygalactose transaminase
VNPHQVTKDFEAALCEYTGAPYAVAVTSCTSALLLACAWHMRREPGRLVATMRVDADARPVVEIPRRTYVSVPQSIVHAGGRVAFRDEDWIGSYQLKPFPIWDCARRFTGGMFAPGQMQCVSFHAAKILGDTQGGAILHDDPAADAWLRRARFDGRREGVAPKDDTFDVIGWHCYLSPDVSARLLFHLSVLPKFNYDLPNDPYPDLSTFEVFR